MLLKSMELHGFKSFARPTTFLFDVPVTAIVGPNGSGKSNCADAFRWVLGEQSFKGIRGRRGEDFIFAGTPGSPRMNYAKVTITFDNTSRVFKGYDFDEVVVSRQVFRDGSNIYAVNGSRIRLRDVVELLTDISLGASQHHVVSQGEADRILSANIYERREMVEDALGIKIYQYKKKEAERKLSKTRENMKEVEALRREIAPHLKFLKKQVDLIEKAREMREQLKGEYLEYLADEDAYIRYEKQDLARRRSDLDREQEQVKLALSEKVEATRYRRRDAAMIKLEELVRGLGNLRTQIIDKERSLGKQEGALEMKNESLERSRGEEEEILVEQDSIVMLSEVRALSLEIEGYVIEAEKSEEVSILRRALQRIRTAIGMFSMKRRESRGQDKKKERLINLENDITDAVMRVTFLKTELTELKNAESKKLAEESILRTDIESMQKEGREAEREIWALRARHGEIRSALDMLSLKKEQCDSLEEDMKREITEGVILVGRDILEYSKDREINKLSVQEDRAIQEGRRRKIERQKIRIEELGGSGEEVLREYEETRDRDIFLESELLDLDKSAILLQEVMDDLSVRIDSEFKNGVQEINKQFNSYFALLFEGGNAKLSIERPVKKRRLAKVESVEDEMSEEEQQGEGLDISVSIPRKKVRSLEALSGGERTMTSIALLFAVTQVKPPPFLILDETDAALDESNSKKYGNILGELARETQLVLITHNRETMSHAGTIYGVTLGQDGVSKQLSIKFEEAEAIAAR